MVSQTILNWSFLIGGVVLLVYVSSLWMFRLINQMAKNMKEEIILLKRDHKRERWVLW
jgi:hypothetical protein